MKKVGSHLLNGEIKMRNIKMKSKTKRKFGLIGIFLVFGGLFHQWFFSEGISWLLQNIPCCVRCCWPKLQDWLVKQSLVPALYILFRSALISFFGVFIALASRPPKIKF
jgi:hypothetical protein